MDVTLWGPTASRDADSILATQSAADGGEEHSFITNARGIGLRRVLLAAFVRWHVGT